MIVSMVIFLFYNMVFNFNRASTALQKELLVSLMRWHFEVIIVRMDV